MYRIDNEYVPEYSGKIKPEFLQRALKAFTDYSGAKTELEERIRENNRWYNSQYTKNINSRYEPEPATAFILNAIENKYADAVDNFPVPNLIEREPGDERLAKMLSKIIPIQLDMNGFKKCYKDNWRRKLKHGTSVYGVFYDEDKEDIQIKVLDILNIYCDMHLTDVQDSPFLFISSIADNEELKETYPNASVLFDGNAMIKTYSGDYEIENRSEIIDCYYKKRVKGKSVLHMMKLCRGHIIDATEDRDGFEDGLYSHGMYPVVFDVLYPNEDSPFGFGIVDVIKNPQMYIDKLDAIISKNAMIAGKIRYMIKDNGGVNEKEMVDYSKDIIHVAGSVDESNIKQLQADSLDGYIINHRQNKINELKEIVGNRDFQQGGTSGGVTAASAISILQQAGEKQSRSIIDDSYDAYRKIIVMVIELIRDFYTAERVYRITNERGDAEFCRLSGRMLEREPVYNGEFKRGDKIEFDISVVPQRQNPYTKELNNQTLITLWQNGFFKAENLQSAAIILDAMQFDGKDKVLGGILDLNEKVGEQNEKGNNLIEIDTKNGGVFNAENTKNEQGQTKNTAGI